MNKILLVLTLFCFTQITFAQIDLQMELDVDNSELAIYSNYNYILTVENAGTATANDVMVSIPVPLGMAFTNQNASQGQYYNWTGDWNIGTIGAGQSANLELVLFTLMDDNPINVYAQVTGANAEDIDSSPNNGTCCTIAEDDEAVATIGGSGGGGSTGVDLELAINVSSDTYNIYENVMYNLSVNNTGNETATNVAVSFPLPNGLVYTSDNPSQGQYSDWTGNWNIGTIGAGQSANLELVLFTLVDGVDITNYAQVVSLNENDSDSTPNNGVCCSANEDDETAITITPANGGGGNTPTCSDGIQNQGETGVDCGGPCTPCVILPTCTDGIQNGNETGVDCGGDCAPCNVAPTCFDGIQNQGETGVDCGGPCTPCNIGGGGGTVDYTAKDQVMPYTGLFRPGVNMGYNPPFQDVELADLAAGNVDRGINGVGAKSIRPGMFETITEIYGYDIREAAFDHYQDLGMDDMTMIVGFPVDWHRDLVDYCGDGEYSALFGNLYTDIWDNGENGTPYNDDNYYAAYLYQVVNTYKDHIKFWEIWNEPGFDLTGNVGWRLPGDPAGNWWDRDPDPCESILRAPIEHYIRTLRISYEIIKTLSPDDYVVVAGVGFESFLDAILRNTDNPDGGSITAEYPHRGGAYFDVMGFHTYPDIDGSVRAYNSQIGGFEYFRHSDAAAKGVTRRQNNYQAILDNYGYDGETYPKKEWIITEFNVPRVQFNANSMSGGNDLQINYIIKATIEAMRADIRQIHAYTLGDKKRESEANTEFDLLGMYKFLGDAYPDNEVMNPIGVSYKTTSDILYGTAFDAQRTAAMNLPSNVGGAAFRKASGEYVYSLWAVTMTDQSEFANANYSFPSGMGINQLFQKEWDYSTTGETSAVSSQNLALTGRPIFLTETANAALFQGRAVFNQATHLSIKNVLPNPAVEYVDLILQSVEAMPVTIDIYDASGILQISKTETVRKGFSTIHFDIDDLATGMYFIHVQSSNRKTTKIKFIKQRM